MWGGDQWSEEAWDWFPYEARVLPPGDHEIDLGRTPNLEFRTQGSAYVRSNSRYGIEVAFTDASGVHWIRDANGALKEIGSPPSTHYRLDRLPNFSDFT